MARRWMRRVEPVPPAAHGSVDRVDTAPRLALPANYQSRTSIDVFDDFSGGGAGLVHQPDVYRLAAHLADQFGSRRLIDVGCGTAAKLLGLETTVERIGIDHPSTVRLLAEQHPDQRWIATDLECPMTDPILGDAAFPQGAVVVCSDVIEHLLDPLPLLELLRSWRPHADAIVLSTPDRVRVRGAEDRGPPANPFHVREWQLDEFHVLLREAGLAPTFIGYTVNNDRDLQKRTILAIIDASLGCFADPPPEFTVEALYSCFNERDIVVQSVSHLLSEGVSVTLIDDWSTDGTWELVHERFGSDPRVRCVRHGETPSHTFEWASVLAFKERLAADSRADWLLHHDADELRFSPWPGVPVRTALWNVQQAGFNAIDHTVLDFRPLIDGFSEFDDPRVFFGHFQWGRRPGHFLQVKGWRNAGVAVDLVSSGGHSADFEGRRVAAYKHLLCHYPLRSLAQSTRKVVAERRDRFSDVERSLGWHVQYDAIDASAPWAWSEEQVERWDPAVFAREYLAERISGVGILR